MAKLYTRVPVPRFPKSSFPLSRPVAGSMNAQRLYCTNAKEVLPGDDWSARSEAFVRLQPMVAPVLAKMSVHQEAFFVPFWQLNEHFDDFITRGERGTYSEHMPYLTVGWFYGFIDEWLRAWEEEDFVPDSFFSSEEDAYNFVLDKVVRFIELSDWFRSVPFQLPEFPKWDPDSSFTDQISACRTLFGQLNSDLSSSPLHVNLAPYLAYLKIYCEFYRDENLVTDYWDGEGQWKDILYEQVGDVTSLPEFDFDTFGYSSLHDFENVFNLFCVKNRAWSKDRFTASLPFVQKGPDVVLPLSGTAPVVNTTDPPSSLTDAAVSITGSQLHAGSPAVDINMYTDFAQASLATTIRDFRTANKLEEFYEADGIGGSRYPENTLIQWGERTPDARLPRAQFLGSFSQMISVAEVAQHSATTSDSPQGNLAGKGTSYGRGFLFGKHFSMHGFILFFTSIKTAPLYEQGINPMFSRYDWTEYAWPRFAHLGEEPVYTKELWVDSSVKEDEVFGYVPRYSSYKTDEGSIHGQLKSSLNFWTLARRFANKPVLNEEFVYGDPRRDAWAITNPFAEQFICEIDYKIKTRRKLPYYGVPSL